MKKTKMFKKLSFVSLLLTLSVLIAPLSGLTAFAGGEVTLNIENRHYADYQDRSVYTSALGLSDRQLKNFKEKIINGVLDHDTTISVSEFRIRVSEDNISALAGLVYKDDPRFFNIKGFSIDYDDYTYVLNTLEITYTYSKTVFRSMLAQCDAAVAELTADLSSGSLSDVEKALLLHDREAVLCEYDTTYGREHAYDMYGALVEHVAVCEGYAQAYNYLLQSVGVDSYMISSDKLNHAWNIVIINGKKYHVDVTWDDPTYDITGRVYHDNFLLSSNAIYGSGSYGHKADDYDTSPTDTTYDTFFWQDSSAEFVFFNGVIYYIDNYEETLNRYKDGVSTTLLSLEDIWFSSTGGYWLGNYARLSAGKNYLYFSLSDGIYRYDEKENKAALCYQPDLSGYNCFSIYGFKADDTYFYLDVYDSPNLKSDTKSLYGIKYAYSEPEPPVQILYGDVSGDGEVDSSDAGMILKYDAGILSLDDGRSAVADVSGDGESDSSDASLILKFDAGIITSFPAAA